MSKANQYVLEIESLKDGLLILYAEQPGQHMRFAPGSRAFPSILTVTSEQFAAHAYDIEGHAEGKYGISQADIQLWVRDVAGKRRERLTFDEALEFVRSGVLDDGAAKSLQAVAEARALAARKAEAVETQGLPAQLEPVAPGMGGFSGPAGTFQPVSPLVET